MNEVPLKVVAIAAVAKNGVIGVNDAQGKGELPWEILEDMKFFKDVTREQIVIMGRKTFQALGKPLPKRENAVITRDEKWSYPGVRVYHELKAAIDDHQNRFKGTSKIIFVIGGAEIYLLSLPLVDEVWLTEIESEAVGDTYFPLFKNGVFEAEFAELERVPKQDQDNAYQYSFVKYARKK